MGKLLISVIALSAAVASSQVFSRLIDWLLIDKLWTREVGYLPWLFIAAIFFIIPRLLKISPDIFKRFNQ